MNDPSPPERKGAPLPAKKMAPKANNTGRVIALPSLSMASVLKAACSSWSLLHPENPADPVTSPWPLVVNAVDCWVRHELSSYDQECTNDTREELHAAIKTAAKRQYPWLRSTVDPRGDHAPVKEPSLLLNEIGRELNNIVEARARLTQQRRRTKDPREIERIDAELGALERQSKLGRDLCQIGRTCTMDGRRALVAEHHYQNRHIFGGRTLSPNFIERVDIRCVLCGGSVHKTKRPIDVGNGSKQTCWSCLCMSVTGRREARITEESWNEWAISGEDDSKDYFQRCGHN